MSNERDELTPPPWPEGWEIEGKTLTHFTGWTVSVDEHNRLVIVIEGQEPVVLPMDVVDRASWEART